MNLNYKHLIRKIGYILVVIALGYLVISGWIQNRRYKTVINTQETELLRGNLELGKANTKVESAASMIDKLSNQIKDEIRKRKAAVNLYSELEARYNTGEGPIKIITRVEYRNKKISNPILSLENNKVFIKLSDSTFEEVTSMKYSYNDFRITISGDAVKETLEYKLHQRFRAIFVETTLPQDIRNHYAEIYELDQDNKPIGKVELIKFNVIRTRELSSHWFWWNPKIDLHVGAGITQSLQFNWIADAGLSISSYGLTINDLTWRFFRLSLGISSQENFSISFSPAQYNLGQKLPLVSNLWIIPYIGYNFPLVEPHFGVGIGVVF